MRPLSVQHRLSTLLVTDEQCWTLVGRRRGPVWLARRVAPTSGDPISVAFDGAAALAREERRRDVVGFLHTHPAGPLRPSRRDVRTMRAWCSALGKPLICLIARADSHGPVTGFCFDDDDSEGVPLSVVALFPRGT